MRRDLSLLRLGHALLDGRGQRHPLRNRPRWHLTEDYFYFNGMRVARVDRPSNVEHLYLNDQLGTARMVVTPTGNNTVSFSDSDYSPYGIEMPVSGSDPNHYKFTGKERDSETGLDDFGARYFTSNAGRFLSPDWAGRPTAVPYAVFGDPQSLNLYGYVRNDPVTNADLDGHAGCGGDKKGICNAVLQAIAHGATASDAIHGIQAAAQKILSYGYVKTGNGTGLGIKGVKVGPVKVNAILRTDGKDVKQTTESKTVTTVNSEIGVKVEVGGLKLGVERTNTQEKGQPANKWLAVFEKGKFEGANAEVGVGGGGCFLLCGQIEVGIQADKILGDIENTYGDPGPPQAPPAPGPPPQ